ncbi:MAG: SRPBCC domain-containing protein, partial [Acidimicrobiia bacterium]
VFEMFTNSTYLRSWLADTALATPRAGGRIYLAWDDGYQTAGYFGMVRPPKALTFTWHGTDELQPTTVEVKITPTESGSRVRVRHTGFGSGKQARGSAKTLKNAWKASLENLASVLSDGADLRITRRPMLGIFVGEEVNPANADRFGADHGVHLDGVAEGMGAAAAGLVAGDVIAALAKRPIYGFNDLRVALSDHRAGDTVEVEFIRDREQMTAPMQLSGRTFQEMPRSGAELAARVEESFNGFFAGLAEATEGITEREAAHRADREWSVRDILAHVIQTEIDGHSNLIEQVEGVERYYDGTFGNSDLGIRVVSDSYPSLGAVVDACRLAMDQTVALLTSLPPELVARKAIFWRIAVGYDDPGRHLTEHLEQIRAARAASHSIEQASLMEA